MNAFILLSALTSVCLADHPSGGHHPLGHHPHGAVHQQGAHHGHQVHQPGAVHGSHQVNNHFGGASVQSHGQVHHGTGFSHQSSQTLHRAPAVHHAPGVHHAPVVHHASHSPVRVAPVVHHAPTVKAAPAPLQTIAELVSTAPEFSTLLAAVSAAGLADTLAGEGPFTVFAPTNAAFDKVPADALNALLADKDGLTAVLLRHVVPAAALQGKDVPPGVTPLDTAGGEEIAAERSNFIKVKSSAGEAFITRFDIIASNGVIHAIDTVI